MKVIFGCENSFHHDNVAEWLRRWIANPLLIERVSSNLTVVVPNHILVIAQLVERWTVDLKILGIGEL